MNERKPKGDATDHSQRDSVYAWYVAFFLSSAFALAYIDRQIIALLVGPIKDDLGLSDIQISLLGGLAFVLFYTLMGIPLGRLADRSNRTRLIAAGMFFWSIMTMLCGFARSFTHLFIARVGVGVGEATLSPSALSIISDYFSAEKLGRATSIYLTGSWVGIGLAFVLGGAIIDFAGDVETIAIPLLGSLKPWQLVFVVVGAPGVVMALLTLTITEPVRRGRLVALGESVPFRQAWAFIWQRKRFYFCHFFGFGLYVAFGLGVSFWAIEYFVRTMEVDRSWISYRYGGIAFVCGASGALASGWLSDFYERRGYLNAKLATALLGMVLALPLGLSLGFVESTGAALALFGALTFLSSFPYAPAAAALQTVTPNELRGLTIGIYLFIANSLGLVIGPTLIATLTELFFNDTSRLADAMSMAAAVLVPPALVLVAMSQKGFARMHALD